MEAILISQPSGSTSVCEGAGERAAGAGPLGVEGREKFGRGAVSVELGFTEVTDVEREGGGGRRGMETLEDTVDLGG